MAQSAALTNQEAAVLLQHALGRVLPLEFTSDGLRLDIEQAPWAANLLAMQRTDHENDETAR